MIRLLLLASVAMTLSGPALAQPGEAASVLAANQRAVGSRPAEGTVRSRWSYDGQGLTGEATEVSDLAHGWYIDDAHAGPAVLGAGYDGRTPWMRDLSSAYTAQEGGDRIQIAINAAYRNGQLWWRADRGGAEIAFAGREMLDGRAMDHLVVTPRGGKRFDAWFDAQTHLLDRIAEDRQFFHARTLYSDYRPEGGMMVAHKMLMDEGAGEASYERLGLKTFAIGPAQPASAYARPTAPPTGVDFDNGATSVTLPFRLLNNHIYIEGKVNGRGPYTFIVDTGGHTLIGPKILAVAGSQAQGSAVSSGAGEKTEVSGLAKVADISFGALHLRNQTAIAQAVYPAEIEGIPVDAMVGFELFRRTGVRIDYGARTITFTDPAHFQPGEAGTELPFKFYDHLPQLSGEIAGIPAIFDIDTGSRSNIDVTSPFVARHQLRQRFAKGVVAVTGWGVGGATHDFMVRLPQISFGPLQIADVPAGLSLAEHGSISDPNYGGNVGSGLLRRFVVTFDYAHQRMWLKPLVPEPEDASDYDRSGMWINASPTGFTVTEVFRGGAAEAAGLHKGDVITAIDGRPARMEELSDARILLRDRPAGSQVRLSVQGPSADRQVVLVLKDQI